jgi:hypothetical protein
MTVEQIEQVERSARVWKQYQADRKWAASNPPTWKPVMTEQQQREHDQYVIANKLPF